MAGRPVNKKVKEAIEEYERERESNKVNFVAKMWDRLGKTGQIITLVVTILTGISAIKPYVVDVIDWTSNLIQSVETTQQHAKDIKNFKKYNEVTSSMFRSILFPYYHTNTDGVKIKLYKTREVNGMHMTYYFLDCCMFFGANYNLESNHWYYIDDTGGYHEITE